jgi:hypothetical protein
MTEPGRYLDDADTTKIEVETERPPTRHRFLKVFLESLRDNLAKATAAGLVAAVATILAKFFWSALTKSARTNPT